MNIFFRSESRRLQNQKSVIDILAVKNWRGVHLSVFSVENGRVGPKSSATNELTTFAFLHDVVRYGLAVRFEGQQFAEATPGV